MLTNMSLFAFILLLLFVLSIFFMQWVRSRMRIHRLPRLSDPELMTYASKWKPIDCNIVIARKELARQLHIPAEKLDPSMSVADLYPCFSTFDGMVLDEMLEDYRAKRSAEVREYAKNAGLTVLDLMEFLCEEKKNHTLGNQPNSQ